MNRKAAPTSASTTDKSGLSDAEFHLQMGCTHLQAGQETEALKWFRRSAKDGNAAALHNIGVMYLAGRGVRANRTQALHYFRVAAKQGSAESKYTLAVQKVSQGHERPGFRMLDKLARSDSSVSSLAQFDLGLMLLQGIGTDRSVARGMEMLERSSEGGNSNAKYVLARMHLKVDSEYYDRNAAAALLSEARRAGNPDAQRLLNEHFPIAPRLFSIHSKSLGPAH